MIKEIFPGILAGIGPSPNPVPVGCTCCCYCDSRDPNVDDTSDDYDDEGS